MKENEPAGYYCDNEWNKKWCEAISRMKNYNWKPNETYQDAEDEHRLWNKEELIDKLIAMTHDESNDQILGGMIRKELIKFSKR